MDPDLVEAAVVWTALALAVGCLIRRGHRSLADKDAAARSPGDPGRETPDT